VHYDFQSRVHKEFLNSILVQKYSPVLVQCHGSVTFVFSPVDLERGIESGSLDTG